MSKVDNDKNEKKDNEKMMNVLMNSFEICEENLNKIDKKIDKIQSGLKSS